jgi:hypothetical protein
VLLNRNAINRQQLTQLRCFVGLVEVDKSYFGPAVAASDATWSSAFTKARAVSTPRSFRIIRQPSSLLPAKAEAPHL